MIKEIKITNFYSFSQETITIQPDVNLLIGINGSGKSNFLKAVRLLKEGVAGVGLRAHIFEHLGGYDNFFFKGDTQVENIEIEYVFDGKAIAGDKYGFQFTEDLIYRITLMKSPGGQNYYVKELIETLSEGKGLVYLDFNAGIGKINGKRGPVGYADFNPQELVLREVSDTDSYFALTTIRKAIRDITVYDYFDTTPRSPIRKPVLPTSEKRLLPDGANLPQILNTIKINYKPFYSKIAAMLNEVNNEFIGFDFNFIGGNIELMLEERNLGSSVHVSSISDGTLRYLCLLAILYNPDRGRFVCIDEPEIGLHPDMILHIANAIKEASEHTTFVISTHSDQLLSYFQVEHLRVFEKENNSTKVNSFTDGDFSGWYEQFTLGQMWKAGDFGGVRYRA